MLKSNRIIVMKYSDLFKYRSVWMGFAISWIFFYHMGFDITIPVISQFKQIGYAGCDIFLFASGLGIYYSLDNNDDVLDYIKKRITRLMPMVWIMLAAWLPFKFYIGEMTWYGAIGNVFGIQYFVDSTYDFNWYIPVTILCYVLAPFLKKLIDSYKTWFGKLLTLIILIGISYAFYNEAYMMLGMCRVGAFFLGMWFGQMGKRGKSISVLSMVMWIILIPVGVFAIIYSNLELGFLGWHLATHWLPFIIAIPGICIAISLLSMLFDKSKATSYLVKFGSFLGNHSLEIYLSHATLVMVFRDYMVRENPELNTSTNWWIVVGVSIVLAFLLYWVDRLVRLPFKVYKENHLRENED